ncbi:unnamed protein product [Trichogramma brassicae]|uniref:Uncharacterized protein n=1 Tax=Trichogramma brassicae TaxID=86971 RepID=A0A6H5IRQ2_9HYME|nr:unnamed protein product [Trichogramma brassicae]
MKRIEGLVKGLADFLFSRNSVHKEVIEYSTCLEQAISSFEKTKKRLVLSPPPSADKAICTSPIFLGSASSKRPTLSQPAIHATSKRYAVAAAPKQPE